MKRTGFHFPQLISVLMSLGLVLSTARPGFAGERVEERNVFYVAYTWHLVRYLDNSTACRLDIEGERIPTGDEIRAACGDTIYAEWRETRPCASAAEAPATCQGLYLWFEQWQEKIRKQIIVYPSIDVKLSLDATGRNLIITAIDQLDGYDIRLIEGRFAGHPFVCDDYPTQCIVGLAPTGEQGKELIYWAISDYGDETGAISVIVRASFNGDFFDVDVLGEPWSGEIINDSAALIWGAFPPDEPPAWLTSPDNLHTNDKLYYLAGRLLSEGLARAGDCPLWGLQDNGYATECGMEAIREDVEAWQNVYDGQIAEAARAEAIPAVLLKRLIAQESQFWGGAFPELQESGPGQITPTGADTLLLWDWETFAAYCYPCFDDDCDLGYTWLEAWQQSMLRHAILEDSGQVDLIARLLVANARQTSNIVESLTGQRPGLSLSYADLWRLTLLNYHAGPGCVAWAISEAQSLGFILDWGGIAPNADRVCHGAASNYVDKITR